MAQKDVTIDDILNGGGSSGAQPVQPSTSATPPVDRHLQGVADYGNGEDIKQKPVTTAEATDPTQAAVNLVEQRRKEQAQRTNIPPVDRHLDGAAGFMNYERAQNGQTPEKSPVFTPNVQTTTPSSTTTPTGSNSDGGKDKDAAAVDTEPQDSKKKSAMKYADMFAAMEPYKEPTKEELEKERKKEKRERLFAAIGDGISALSNLFFTTQYAPNMYDPNKETNSEKVENYWTNLRKEREANRQRYVDGYIKAKQADDLHAIQQQNADVNDFYKRSEAERKAKAQEIIDAKTQAMTDYYKEKAKGVGKYDETQLVYLKTKIDCLNKGMSIKEAVAAAQIAKLNAEANKANRTGGGSGGKGGRTGGGSGGRSGGGKSGVSKSGGGYPWYDKNGVLHYAKTEGIAKQMSKQNGTYRDDYSTNRSSMVDSNGKQIGVGTSRTTHNGWHSVRPQNHTQPNGGHSVRPKMPAKKGGGAKGGKWASGLKL